LVKKFALQFGRWGWSAAIKGDKTIAQLAEQFDVHANQITTWKDRLQQGAADVFGPGGGAGTAASTPSVDVKSLHAKIGELTLENDFLEGALIKAGARFAGYAAGQDVEPRASCAGNVVLPARSTRSAPSSNGRRDAGRRRGV
jgi:transposase-like protein